MYVSVHWQQYDGTDCSADVDLSATPRIGESIVVSHRRKPNRYVWVRVSDVLHTATDHGASEEVRVDGIAYLQEDVDLKTNVVTTTHIHPDLRWQPRGDDPRR